MIHGMFMLWAVSALYMDSPSACDSPSSAPVLEQKTTFAACILPKMVLFVYFRGQFHAVHVWATEGTFLNTCGGVLRCVNSGGLTEDTLRRDIDKSDTSVDLSPDPYLSFFNLPIDSSIFLQKPIVTVTLVL